jgi:hypothetical protein
MKDIIYKTDFDEYYILEKKSSSKLLSDIQNLKFGKLNENCFIDQTYYKINQDVYINIHFMRTNILYYFALKDNEWLAYKSLLDAYYKYYSFIYNKLTIQLNEKNSYIPEIDYSKFEIENVDKYIKNNEKFKILICNGDVLSAQSNILLDSIINKLSDIYPNIDFILTKKIDIVKDNILFTNNLINCNLPDLNEISYLSTFCNIIIGRASGPYCYTLTKHNFNDFNKTFIAITSSYIIAFYSEFSKSDRILITNNDSDNIFDIINDEIIKKYNLFFNKKYIKELNILRTNNQVNFQCYKDLYNITINSYIDLNNDGNFDISYGALYPHIAKNVNYFFIINRIIVDESKVKLKFSYFNETIHEIIL